MKKTRWPILFVLLAVGVATFAFVTRPVARAITVKIVEPEGVSVTAACEVDGETRDLPAKVAPAEYSLKAQTLSMEVRRADGTDEFVSVNVYVEDELKYTAKAKGGVRVRIDGSSYFNFGEGSSGVSGISDADE